VSSAELLLNRLWQRGREFLGVEYPILGGAMSWLSESQLVSAISNAGGFGVIAGGNMPAQLLKDEIAKTHDKTDKPFGVNLITIAPNFRSHLDMVLEAGHPFIVFAGGLPPRDALKQVNETSSKLICFAPNISIARMLAKSGADALIIEGSEAGGHIGPVSTSVLAEQILPTIRKIPVFAAGGIATGRLMLHFLMMGASGVQLGTRFAVSTDSIAHPNFKKALIKAKAKDAVPTSQFDPRLPVIPVRSLVNGGTRDFNTLQLGLIQQIERSVIGVREAVEELEKFWIGGLKKAVIDGDIERGSLMAGQSVGLVTKEEPASAIIASLIKDAEDEAEKILNITCVNDREKVVRA
jgi:enoyl-[acyl-carrier protein] reductase II